MKTYTDNEHNPIKVGSVAVVQGLNCRDYFAPVPKEHVGELCVVTKCDDGNSYYPIDVRICGSSESYKPHELVVIGEL